MHAAGDDRIRPEVRAVAAFIVFVLVIAVIVLYLMPTETARLWAWTITPTMTPMLMGAGYGAGAYFFARVLRAPRWHHAAIGFLAITLFTWCMLASTLLHWDRFNHGHVAFWGWFGLYLVTPLLVPALWLRNRAADPGNLEPDDVIVPGPARIGIAAVGVAILLLALVMFVAPALVMDNWPWQLTPLTARVIAGFLGLTGASLVGIANDRRWSSARIMLESLILGTILILAAVPRAWDNFDPTEPARWIFVAGLCGGLAALLWLYFSTELRSRTQRIAKLGSHS
jgi:peptidoglycan/LPS O-acetylase OafA/YrhL